jgi:hypothetical protein
MESSVENNHHSYTYTYVHVYIYLASLLGTRTVEADKQPLLGNAQYTRSKGTRHVRCDVMQQ